jgi:hypothetical protein
MRYYRFATEEECEEALNGAGIEGAAYVIRDDPEFPGNPIADVLVPMFEEEFS